MKVSGFSFIRDGERLGYPFLESLRSVLPLCDEFVIAVAESEDRTLEMLESLDEPKLRLIKSVWNESCRSHGYVYAQQKMIAQFNCTGDWAFYLEADEVLHEKDIDHIRAAMEFYLSDEEVEVLAFDYYHFYGDANHLHLSSQTYHQAARIIRNKIRSMAPDGLYWAVIKEKSWLGGRNKRRTRYPKAAALNIPIYHYGNARHERYFAKKAELGNQYWTEKQAFYSSYGDIDPEQFGEFHGQHPEVMLDWLNEHVNPSFEFNPDHELTRREKKHRLLSRLEKRFHLDLSKKHFRIIRSYKHE